MWKRLGQIVMEANEDVHGGNTEAGDSNNPNMYVSWFSFEYIMYIQFISKILDKITVSFYICQQKLYKKSFWFQMKCQV